MATARAPASTAGRALRVSGPTPLVLVFTAAVLAYASWDFIYLLLAVAFVSCWVASVPLIVFALAWKADQTAARSAADDGPGLRPFQLSTPAGWQASQETAANHTVQEQLNKVRKQPLHPNSAPVNKAIDQLLELIIRDFVCKWHDGLARGDAPAGAGSGHEDDKGNVFPAAVEVCIRRALHSLLERITRLDVSTLAVTHILPEVTAHMKHFHAAEIHSLSAGPADVSGDNDFFIARRYLNGNLHPAVGSLSNPSSKATEELHLRKLAEKALRVVLPEAERSSRAVFVVVRELIACTILRPTIDSLSDPDLFNQMLSRFASEALQEQQMVHKLREMISQEPASHAPSEVRAREGKKRVTSAAIPAQAKRHSFDEFLHRLRITTSLMEVRGMRNELSKTHRKVKAQLSLNANLNDVGKKVAQIDDAIQLADQRIADLGGAPPNGAGASVLPTSAAVSSELTLQSLLANPSALSHFMEWMERRRQAPLLQFWLAVESFKDPLEVVDEPEVRVAQASASAPRQQVNHLRDDVELFRDTYFPVLQIDSKIRQTVDHFLAAARNGRASNQAVYHARQSIVKAQAEVLETLLEEHWPAFKRSELFHIAATEVAKAEEAGRRALQAEVKELGGDDVGYSRSSSPGLGLGLGKSGLTPYEVLVEQSTPPDTAGAKPGRSTNLDYLTATQSRTKGTRSPLFAEPLFGEDEQESSPTPGLSDEHDHSDHVDAIKDALRSIVTDDRRSDKVQSWASEPLDDTGRPLISPSPLLDAAAERDAQQRAHAASSQTAKSKVPDRAITASTLDEQVQQLSKQRDLLDQLMRKAELTGASEKESSILRKSMRTVESELHSLEWQRDQSRLMQGVKTIVPGRTVVRIDGHTTSKDADGKEFTLYLIEVGQLDPDNPEKVGSGWLVPRRYSEFWALHQRLKEKVPAVRALESELPGKRLVSITAHGFVDVRRQALERYLKLLVQNEDACHSEELRAFLVQTAPEEQAPDTAKAAREGAFPGKHLFSSIMKGVSGVTEGIDDVLFMPSMLDVVVQQLSTESPISVWSAPTMFWSHRPATPTAPAGHGGLSRHASEIKLREAERVHGAFVQPICDFLLELFDLRGEKDWLRRQAIVVIMQQVLGGTVERRVKDAVSAALSSDAIVRHIASLQGALWVDGELKPPGIPRSPAVKWQTRDTANRQVSKLIPGELATLLEASRERHALIPVSSPDVAASIIGRQHARKAVRTIFSMLQYQRLNKHLIYRVMDLIFDELFPSPSR